MKSEEVKKYPRNTPRNFFGKSDQKRYHLKNGITSTKTMDEIKIPCAFLLHTLGGMLTELEELEVPPIEFDEKLCRLNKNKK